MPTPVIKDDITYSEEEYKKAKEIYIKRINREKMPRMRFDTALFAAYVDVSSDGEYALFSEFTGMQHRALILHKTCGNVYEILPERYYYANCRCPKCSNKKKVSTLIQNSQVKQTLVEKIEPTDTVAIPTEEKLVTVEEETVRKVITAKDVSQEAMAKFFNTVPANKLENTQILLQALNSGILLFGAYAVRSKTLLLYTVDYNRNIINTYMEVGEIDTRLFNYKLSRAILLKFDKNKQQYEFYNVTAFLKMLSSSIDKNDSRFKCIFKDPSETIIFTTPDKVPENILTIKPGTVAALKYSTVYNTVKFCIMKRLIPQSKVNNIISDYMVNGYKSILYILPWSE